AGSPNVPTDVSSSAASAGVSSKDKSPMVEEEVPVKARTFKQMEEDRLGKEAAKRLHDEEIAQLERQRAEVQRKRQQDVIDFAMYYNEADWLNIRAQVEANASFSKTLLGSSFNHCLFTSIVLHKEEVSSPEAYNNGPTPHPQTTDLSPEGGVVPPLRNKRDKEFTEKDNINELMDIQAINILSQGPPRHLDTLLGSQRFDKNKEGLGYSAIPPPAQVYSPLKKDMSWTRLPKFADDTITDFSRPSPSIESNTNDL
nr:JmjC domain-containing protein [Tanacetum cinerariifolium]